MIDIFCLVDDSHEMSSLIFTEQKIKVDCRLLQFCLELYGLNEKNCSLYQTTYLT